MGFFSATVNVPKKIHFIWVGGALNAMQAYHISAWARKNAGWEIWVWRDQKHLAANVLRKAVAAADTGDLRMKNAASRSYTGDAQRVSFMQAHNLYNHTTHVAIDEVHKQRDFVSSTLESESNVVFKDVNTDLGGMQNAGLYTQEMGDWGGNMAAASDILRIEILIKYGGIYLDVDLECLKTFGTFTVRKDLAKFGNWPNPQDQRPRINNAIIACAPKSELMKKYRERVKRNYDAKAMSTETLQALVNNEITLLTGSNDPNEKQKKFNALGGHWKGNLSFFIVPKGSEHHSAAVDDNGRSDREKSILRTSGPSAAAATAAAYHAHKHTGRNIDDDLVFPQGYVNFETAAQKVSATRGQG